MSYGGYLKRKEFQQSMLPSSYTNIVTSIRACDDEFVVFPIKIGTIKSRVNIKFLYFETLVMDKVKLDIQWDILADDVVLIDKSKIKVD
jgi:hypothetical protein